MVGVAADTSKQTLSSRYNPIVKYLLKEREEHAKAQKHDYSHVFRRKSRFDMFRLSAVAMAIEFAYAAETSFVSPILLQIGVNHKHMTMAWGLSPLIGFFVSPLLGSISDRCKLSWGRRRPIISLLSFGIFLGLILVPYGRDIGVLLGDTGYSNTTLEFRNSSGNEGTVAARLPEAEELENINLKNNKFAVILTILGMVLLDFDADTCQTPARTYILDVCIPEDQSRGLTTFSLLAGLGGTIGYAIGGIDWERTQIGTFLGGNIPTVFGLVTIIFVICYLITITSFREIPLKLIEQDEMLKPLSSAHIKRESSKKRDAIYYIKESTALELRMAGSDGKEDINPCSSPYLDGYQNNSDGQTTQVEKIQEDFDDADVPISLTQYLKSIFVMPYSMAILSTTNLFCWMGHVTYCLYFTDFVGEAVFHGDPKASPSSEAAQLYEAGVRFGCFGMSIYAFSCSLYSISVTKLMKWMGARVVYVTGILYYALGMLILGLWPTKWGVLVFSTSAGVLYGTLFTMPYILVANYHAKNCFRVRNGETVALKQKRGLGTDVAIISSMVFVAQLIVSVTVGPLVDIMQTTCAILFASTGLAFIGAICAMFVLYV